MSRVVGWLWIVLCLPVALIAQESGDAAFAAVDSLLRARFPEDGPGAAVAVVRNGETVFLGGAGLANLEHGARIGPDTRFHLVSGSKQFTAYALTLLEHQGRLELDDDVRTYLPELPDYGARITLRQLVHHTSGIRQATMLQNYTVRAGAEFLTQERSLQLIFNQTTLNFEPGSRHRYSDSGYILLGTIIERVTDRPLPEWLHEHVFAPIGMTQTSIVTRNDEVVPDRADPYVPSEDGIRRGGAVMWTFYGGTGVYSSARDLGLWLAFLDSPQAEPVVSAMEERGVLTNGDTLVWGRGLVVEESPEGVRRVWHSGDAAGYRAWIGRYPELGLGIVVLANSDAAVPFRIADDIVGLLDEGALREEVPPRVPADVRVDPKRLERYAGHYRIDVGIFGTADLWTVTVTDGHLSLAQRDAPAMPMIPVADSVFGLEEIPVTLTFHEAESGRVDAVTMRDPTSTWPGVRYADLGYEAPDDDIAVLEGRYYSPELDVMYDIEVRDGAPVLLHVETDAHRRRDPMRLRAVAPDLFRSTWAIFDQVRVERSDDRRITGLIVTDRSQRVDRLRFERR